MTLENPNCHARRFPDGQFRCQQCGVVFDADDNAPCEDRATPRVVDLKPSPVPDIGPGIGPDLQARFDSYDSLARTVGLPPLSIEQKRRAAAFVTKPDKRRRRRDK